MKKISLMLLASLGLAVVVNAQPGSGFQRRTPEERTASIHAKLDSAFKLDAAKMTNLDSALVTLFRARDKKMQELREGGSPDRETMMAEMKKFSDAQDEILKAVLAADQFTIWKEKIEPSMRPQRPQQAPSGNN